MKRLKDNLANLPFDQYTRQEIVRKIVENCIRPVVETKRLKIVDFGGHKGHTADFFPRDEITILDVFEENYQGYIKGDASHTPFKDKQFDIVVSFDTLEHIPKEKRLAFVKEAARVAKHAFIIAAPFENKDKTVGGAERLANELYKKVKGLDHPWLSEHIEYGLPDSKTIERYISDTQNGYIKFPTNNLSIWLLTQGIMFNSSVFKADIKEVVDVSRIYNSNIDQMEALTGDTYRIIYLGSSDKRILSLANKVVGKKEIPHTQETQNLYIDSVNNAYRIMMDRLLNDREYLLEREKHLQNMYDNIAAENTVLTKRIHQINNSKTFRLARKVSSLGLNKRRSRER